MRCMALLQGHHLKNMICHARFPGEQGAIFLEKIFCLLKYCLLFVFLIGWKSFQQLLFFQISPK
jgi:hypothetical protein